MVNPEEQVVMVDEDDCEIGVMPKRLVHGATTPLHRGFSAFLFRAQDRQLLLQQRSARKATWPSVWSNSCCGHPAPGEGVLDAARRRIRDELGLTALWLAQAAPYRYCFTRDGVMENEVCPIVVGLIDQEPVPDPGEVQGVRWVVWRDFLAEISRHPDRYSEWCVEEARLLAASGVLAERVFA